MRAPPLIVTWTDFDGTRHCVSSDGELHEDLASTQRKVLEQAIAEGWTPARWWQWWRRRDVGPASTVAAGQMGSGQKADSSEVWLVLPGQDFPVLTKESGTARELPAGARKR